MSKNIKRKRTRCKKASFCAALLVSLAYCGGYPCDAYGMQGSEQRVFKTLANGFSYVDGAFINYSIGVSGVSTGADYLYLRSQAPDDAYVAQGQNEGALGAWNNGASNNGVWNSGASNNGAAGANGGVWGSLVDGGTHGRVLNEPSYNKTTNASGSDVVRSANFQSFYYSFKGETSFDNGYVDTSIYRSGDFIHSRVGGMGSVSWRDSHGSEIALHAGYARGNLYQTFESSTDHIWGYFAESEDIDVKIRLTDFQFGATFQQRFDNGVLASLRVDGGAQDYGWSRSQKQIVAYDEYGGGVAFVDELEQAYRASLTGNTLKATLCLTKEFDFHNGWRLFPMISAESANSWIYSGDESGSNVSYLIEDWNMREVWKPWALSETMFYSRNLARIGSHMDYRDDGLTITMRAFYSTQLGGRNAAAISLVDVDTRSVGVNVDGSGFGRDCLQLGAGTRLALDQANRSFIAGSYDVFCYRKGTGQTAVAMLGTTF